VQPLPWSFALLLLDFFCWTRCFLFPFPHIPPPPTARQDLRGVSSAFKGT
jgi:hypothetical protein